MAVGDILTFVDSDGVTRVGVVTEDLDRRMWLRKNLSGDKIVDIGCNEGIMFRDHPLVSHITGVDIDIWNPPGYAKFVRADAESLPFADDEFDMAVVAEILEHVPDPIKVLKESRRVAKSILFTVPNEYNWSKNVYPFMTVEDRLHQQGRTFEQEMMNTASNKYCSGVVDDRAKPHLFHIRYYTMETLADAFKQAGLEAHIEPLDYDMVDNGILAHWSYFVGWAK